MRVNPRRILREVLYFLPYIGDCIPIVEGLLSRKVEVSEWKYMKYTNYLSKRTAKTSITPQWIKKISEIFSKVTTAVIRRKSQEVPSRPRRKLTRKYGWNKRYRRRQYESKQSTRMGTQTNK